MNCLVQAWYDRNEGREGGRKEGRMEGGVEGGGKERKEKKKKRIENKQQHLWNPAALSSCVCVHVCTCVVCI